MLHILSRLNGRRGFSQNNWEAESGKPLKPSPYLSPKFVIHPIYFSLSNSMPSSYQTYQMEDQCSQPMLYFRPKWLKHHTLWNCTYLCSPNKRIHPHPPATLGHILLIQYSRSQEFHRTSCICTCTYMIPSMG